MRERNATFSRSVEEFKKSPPFPPSEEDVALEKAQQRERRGAQGGGGPAGEKRENRVSRARGDRGAALNRRRVKHGTRLTRVQVVSRS